jgi:nicotinamide-nucleotide amidase
VHCTSILIISGGLGPTEDDITCEALAAAVGKRLEPRSEIAERIQERYKHIHIPEDVLMRQALVPEGATLIENPVGTAPGVVLQEEGTAIIALPGVPGELHAMTPKLLSILQEKFPTSSVVLSSILKIAGIGESGVNEKIIPLMQLQEPRVGLLALPNEVHIRLTARGERTEAEAALSRLKQELYERLGELIFGENEDTLERVVAGLLLQTGLTLSLAESCTGGLISHRLTEVPGISAAYFLGVVSYSNTAKMHVLGVPPDLIELHGAVSPEVASAMAKGIRSQSGSDIALALTGIAGPSGGTAAKPVGLIYIALASPEHTLCNRYQFPGTRHIIKLRASQAGLDLVRKYLLQKLDKAGLRSRP